MCFRREVNFCVICFTTAITPILGANTAELNNNQASFGLSVSNAAGTAAQQESTACTDDYLIIPNFQEGVRRILESCNYIKLPWLFLLHF